MISKIFSAALLLAMGSAVKIPEERSLQNLLKAIDPAELQADAATVLATARRLAHGHDSLETLTEEDLMALAGSPELDAASRKLLADVETGLTKAGIPIPDWEHMDIEVPAKFQAALHKKSPVVEKFIKDNMSVADKE